MLNTLNKKSSRVLGSEVLRYIGGKTISSTVKNYFCVVADCNFSNGFNLTIISASINSVSVNIPDMPGRIVETYTDVTEQTVIGTKLNAGIYFAEAEQGGNRQMLRII